MSVEHFHSVGGDERGDCVDVGLGSAVGVSKLLGRKKLAGSERRVVPVLVIGERRGARLAADDEGCGDFFGGGKGALGFRSFGMRAFATAEALKSFGNSFLACLRFYSLIFDFVVHYLSPCHGIHVETHPVCGCTRSAGF
jgi:hypothetical protein